MNVVLMNVCVCTDTTVCVPDVIHTVAPGTPPLGHPWGLTREAPGGDGLTRREMPQVGP